ncbi:hypothetical protein KUTeg_005651 [Tegillarca granosa]|uniref:Uncharacterized protein n=1 Tax=Tegillarca granosa TaxID=220873 RepID=A0ABQ9FM85_TEGGR|nr:hypothetical protein KUTeg_005651 [Tegillarca granosa]
MKSMADETEDSENEIKTLIGINLINGNNDQKDYTSLGVVVIPKSHIHTRYISHLRILVCHQIHTLPSSFTFCTTQGWIITKVLEESIKIKDIVLQSGAVNIQRCFDKPKVGIKTKSGEALGFIFVEYSTLLCKAREIIDEQIFQRSKRLENYWFVDPNGWPVNEEQEIAFGVIDIINGSCLTLDGAVIPGSSSSSSYISSPSPKAVRSSLLGKRHLSFRDSKDLDRCQVADSSVGNIQYAKQILISYVRADAAHHALDLKQELSLLGFSVYLVKLADVLGKIILPVSFLEEWPPRCLAIQFATTQYINWKTPAQIQTEVAEGGIDQAKNIRYWNNKYVKYVAKEIGERLEDFLGLSISRVPSLTRRVRLCSILHIIIQHSYLIPTVQLHEIERLADTLIYPEFELLIHVIYNLLRFFFNKSVKTVVKSCACVEESNPLALTTDREGYPLLVLCIHPKQAEYGLELKKWFEEKKYEVWCTTELEFSYPDSLPSSEVISLSQASSCGALSDVECENRQKFQEKADDAGIIVFVVSRDFILSKTCQQQLFYCEQRKRMIALKYEKFYCPGWMSMLIGNDSWEVKHLKKSLSVEDAVYIAGSTVFHSERSYEICRKIGQHLATLDSISVVTGGFYGVGETVGKAFYEETQKLWKKHKVWHILPEQDSSDRRKQARQNLDGTFRVIDYGKTLFYGDCVRERETIAARVFDICILIEGGPGAAHEAEEFTWNDHIVIPVKCTGGAAGGEFNVPKKIFETPQSVSENDWSILFDETVTPDTIGQAVKRIVECLQKKLNVERETSDSSTRINSPNKSVLKSNSPEGQKTSLSSMKTVIINDTRTMK